MSLYVEDEIPSASKFNQKSQTISTSAPTGSNRTTGSLWYDTTGGAGQKQWNGSAWIGSTFGGDVYVQGYKLKTSNVEVYEHTTDSFHTDAISSTHPIAFSINHKVTVASNRGARFALMGVGKYDVDGNYEHLYIESFYQDNFAINVANGGTGVGRPLKIQFNGTTALQFNADLTVNALSRVWSNFVANNPSLTGNVLVDTASARAKVTIQSAGQSSIPALGATDVSGMSLYLSNSDPAYGLLIGVLSDGNAWLQAQRTDGTPTGYNLRLQPNGGTVILGGDIALSSGQPIRFNGSGSSDLIYRDGNAIWFQRAGVNYFAVTGSLVYTSAANFGVNTSSPNAVGTITGLGGTNARIYDGSNQGRLIITGQSAAELHFEDMGATSDQRIFRITNDNGVLYISAASNDFGAVNDIMRLTHGGGTPIIDFLSRTISNAVFATSVQINSAGDAGMYIAESGSNKWTISYSVGGDYMFIRDIPNGRDLMRFHDSNLIEMLQASRFENYFDMKQIAAPADPSANYGRIYVKQIDANNDGVFAKIKRAGAFVEVQII